MRVPGVQDAAKNQEDYLLEEMHYDRDGLRFSVSGNDAKIFYCGIIRMFRSFGGKNFITTTVSYKASKYAITIQNYSGDDAPETPAEMITLLESENKNLRDKLKALGEIL